MKREKPSLQWRAARWGLLALIAQVPACVDITQRVLINGFFDAFIAVADA